MIIVKSQLSQQPNPMKNLYDQIRTPQRRLTDHDLWMGKGEYGNDPKNFWELQQTIPQYLPNPKQNKLMQYMNRVVDENPNNPNQISQIFKNAVQLLPFRNDPAFQKLISELQKTQNNDPQKIKNMIRQFINKVSRN